MAGVSATEEAVVATAGTGAAPPPAAGPVAVVWCRQVDNEAESPGYTTVPDQFPGRAETLEIIRVVGNLTINVADTSDYWTPGPPASLTYYPNLFVYPAYGGRYICLGRMFLSTEDRPRLGMKTFVLDTQQLLQSGDFGGSLLRWHATMGPPRVSGGRTPPPPNPAMYSLLAEGLLFHKGDTAPVVAAAATEWPACVEVVTDLVRNLPASLLMLGAILVFPYFLPQPKVNLAEFTEQVPLALAVMRIPPSEAAGDRHAKRIASWESTKVTFRDLTDPEAFAGTKSKESVPLVVQYLRDHNPAKLAPIAQRVDLVEVPKVTAVLQDADRAAGKERRKEMSRIGAAMETAALQLAKVKGRAPAGNSETTRRAQAYIAAEIPKASPPASSAAASTPAGSPALPSWLSKAPVAMPPGPGGPAAGPAPEIVPVSTSEDPSLLPQTASAPPPAARPTLPGASPAAPSALPAVGAAVSAADLDRAVRAELDRRGFASVDAKLNQMLQATESRLARTITEMDTRWQAKLGPTVTDEAQRNAQLEAIRHRIEERTAGLERLIETRSTKDSLARDEAIDRRVAAERQALEASWFKQVAQERVTLEAELARRAVSEKAERDAALAAQITAARTAWDAEWGQRLTKERAAWESEFTKRTTAERAALDAELAKRTAAERASWDTELSRRLATEKASAEADGSKRTSTERVAAEAGLAKRLAAEKTQQEGEFAKRLAGERAAIDAEWSKRLATERSTLEADWTQRLAAAQLAFDAAVAARLEGAQNALTADWSKRLEAERSKLDVTWSQRLAEEKSLLDEEWNRRLASERGSLDEGWSKRFASERGITDQEVAKRLKAVEDRIRGLGSLDDAMDRRIRGALESAGLPREAGAQSAFADGIAQKLQVLGQSSAQANAVALQQLERRMDERWKLLAALTGAEAALAAKGGSAPTESLTAQFERRFAEREAAMSKTLTQLRQEVLARVGSDLESRLVAQGDALGEKIERETETRATAMEADRAQTAQRLDTLAAKVDGAVARVEPLEARLRQEIALQAKTAQDVLGRMDAEGRQRTQAYTDLRSKQLIDREHETTQADLAGLRKEMQGAVSGLLDATRLEQILQQRLERSNQKLQSDITAIIDHKTAEAAEAAALPVVASLEKVEAVEGEIKRQSAELLQLEDRLRTELGQIDRRLVALTERMVPVIRKTWLRIAEMERQTNEGSPDLEARMEELRRELKDEMRRISDDQADRTRDVRQRLEDRIGQQEQVWGIMARGLAEMRNRRLRDSGADLEDDLPPRRASDDDADDDDAPPRRRRAR